MVKHCPTKDSMQEIKALLIVVRDKNNQLIFQKEPSPKTKHAGLRCCNHSKTGAVAFSYTPERTKGVFSSRISIMARITYYALPLLLGLQILLKHYSIFFPYESKKGTD
ncbi:MAG: hypothetical protein ONA69_06845 [candidate division KSB1 bacterium]|nr:hypothetical protein [candidate division KSB1 bacterium]